MLEPSEPAPMLRLVPLGWDALAEGVTEGLADALADGLTDRLADGLAVGPVVVGVVQLPEDTCRPLLAPAVWLTMVGTQLAPSRL